MLRFLAAILLSAVPFSVGHAQPSAAGGTAAAGSTEAPTCVWSSRSFGLNALFCVAPNVALQCVAGGRWAVIQGYTFGENVRPCANSPVMDPK
jgi:hypothetical protein